MGRHGKRHCTNRHVVGWNRLISGRVQFPVRVHGVRRSGHLEDHPPPPVLNDLLYKYGIPVSSLRYHLQKDTQTNACAYNYLIALYSLFLYIFHSVNFIFRDPVIEVLNECILGHRYFETVTILEYRSKMFS